MAANVLVFAEQRAGVLKRSVLELVGLAQDVAAGGEVHALVLGKDVRSVADEVAGYGAKVHLTDDASLEFAAPEAYVAQIHAAVEAVSPQIVLLPASAMGRDLAPRLAARMNASFVAECLSLEASGDGYQARKSMYGGKIFATVAIKSAAPVVATVKPGAHAPAAAGSGGVSDLAVSAPAALRAKVTDVAQEAKDRVDLQEAEIVVSGGRGLKSAENFHLVEDMAKPLGAAVGASRAIVDAGWVPHHYQVGQTGVTVSPKLYIACGISGAIQHLAGMRTSGCIVAINKDPEAPIFKVADYGIVGDVFEVAPLMTEELKKARDGA